jgi:5-methylcytosine-specific restriction protein A
MSEKKKDSDWSVSEIKAAVDAYLKMLALELSGQKFVKTEVNLALRKSALPTRTKGSVCSGQLIPDTTLSFFSA